MLGLSDKSGDIMRTVDKIEKIGPDLVRAILVDDYAIEGEKADEILAFIGIKGTNEEVLAALAQYRGRNEIFDQGLDELTTVAKYLGSFGVPQENFAVDLTIARGLDYYTGTVYETTLLDHPEIGSVCSGGRYDNLAEYYTDRKLPGVGISIGVTRLFYVLGEQGLLNDEICTAPADVLILPMTEDLSEAIALATRSARRGRQHADLHGKEEVQGQDELCRQAQGAVCLLPRRGRDRRGRRLVQGHAHGRAGEAPARGGGSESKGFCRSRPLQARHLRKVKRTTKKGSSRMAAPFFILL